MAVVGQAIARREAIVERKVVKRCAVHRGADAERQTADVLIDGAGQIALHVVKTRRGVAERSTPLVITWIANVREAGFRISQRHHRAVFQNLDAGSSWVALKVERIDGKGQTGQAAVAVAQVGTSAGPPRAARLA